MVEVAAAMAAGWVARAAAMMAAVLAQLTDVRMAQRSVA